MVESGRIVQVKKLPAKAQVTQAFTSYAADVQFLVFCKGIVFFLFAPSGVPYLLQS